MFAQKKTTTVQDSSKYSQNVSLNDTTGDTINSGKEQEKLLIVATLSKSQPETNSSSTKSRLSSFTGTSVGVTYYDITCITNIAMFKRNYNVVQRRYSQFLKLHNKIRKMVMVAEFPGKTYFSAGSAVIERRIRMLNNYFEYLCADIAGKEDVLREIVDFVENDKY